MTVASKIKRPTRGKPTAEDIAELKRELEPWQKLVMQTWEKIDD